MKSTREGLLEYLMAHQTASSPELSRHLQVTEANIRYHLNQLVKQRLVQKISYQKQPGRGRPRQVYSLTASSLGDGFAELTGALLRAIPAENPGILRQAAEQLASSPPTKETTGTLTQRILHAVNRLNQLNYHARWEARRGAPALTFDHCPYSKIIAEHPELCQVDLHLIETLAGTSSVQTKKLERSASGTLHCEFRITGS